MNARAFLHPLLLLAIAGCATAPALPPPGVDHPANPDAPEIPPARTSDTLAIQPASQPTTAPTQGEHHHAH
jgi:hypothetical protein